MNFVVIFLLFLSPVWYAQAQDQAQAPTPPPNPKVQQALAASIEKLGLGDATGALQAVQQALKLDPYVPQAWAQRAIVRMDMKDWPGAIADASKAMELGLKTGIAYNIRARAYMQDGKFPEALADAEEALKSEPLNAQAYLNRAQARELSSAVQTASNQAFSPDAFLSDYKNASLLDPSLKGQSDAAFARYPGPHNIITIQVPDRGGNSADFTNLLSHRWLKRIIAAVFIFLVVMTIREQWAKRRDSKI